MARCDKCGAKAGFMMSLCDECIARGHDAARAGRTAAGAHSATTEDLGAVATVELSPAAAPGTTLRPSGTTVTRIDITFGNACELVWNFAWASVLVGLVFGVVFGVLYAVFTSATR